MTENLLGDCFAHNADRLRHDEALGLLKSRIKPVADLENVSLPEASGRILAEAATALTNVPAHTNAAVDGYAVAFADYDAAAGGEFRIFGRAAAGHPMTEAPPPGSAARIFTGAVMPPGLDSVVMQEDVRTFEKDGRALVQVPKGLKAGANVREAGEDVTAGGILLDAGALLRPQDLAALASIGLGELRCFMPLKVALFSTGDEIVRPGARLGPGQVYDANAPMLRGLISGSGADVADLGVLPDSPDAMAEALADAAGRFDVIITSGSASVGEEDHLIGALERLGKRHLWQIAIKPGRPMSFGQIGDCVVLGLPGNPVAVFVCFLLYGWPMLRRLGGAPWPEPQRLIASADFTMPGRKTGRREFLRGTIRLDRGAMVAEKFARDGSGLITSLRAADGLIDIPEDVPEIRRGDKVAFIPFSQFGILRQ